MAENSITTMEDLVNQYKDDEQSLLDLARYAEKAERFKEMTEFMKALINKKKGAAKTTTLEIEERNMLSISYKNVVGRGRSGHRNLSDPDNSEASFAGGYKQIIEAELKAKCNEILNVITESLLPEQSHLLKMRGIDPKTNAEYASDEALAAVLKEFSSEVKESTVFYLKMCGDYYRYLAEFQATDEVKNQADSYYTQALEVAKNGLAPTHPTRLGLILNASVCKYEILKKPQDATQLAKSGFDDAISKLDHLNDENYKDSTLIMQLLRDNLTIWTTSGDDNNDRED